jgi:predicted NAD/FAD-binding protein
MEAVENGLTQRVQTILQEDPEALNRPFQDYPLFPLYAEGWHTPLAFAVAQDKPDVVRFLLAHGADAKVHSPEGQTLYGIAKEKGHQEIAEMLKAYAP